MLWVNLLLKGFIQLSKHLMVQSLINLISSQCKYHKIEGVKITLMSILRVGIPVFLVEEHFLGVRLPHLFIIVLLTVSNKSLLKFNMRIHNRKKSLPNNNRLLKDLNHLEIMKEARKSSSITLLYLTKWSSKCFLLQLKKPLLPKWMLIYRHCNRV
jgi:hypothetical protein